jgi:hypothetical protein
LEERKTRRPLKPPLSLCGRGIAAAKEYKAVLPMARFRSLRAKSAAPYTASHGFACSFRSRRRHFACRWR